MAYRVVVLPAGERDLGALDASVRRRVLLRIVWLGEHAAETIHHRMSNLPDDLSGLCRLRVGHYRILYWVYLQRELLTIYRVQHRREVYENL